MNNNSQLRHQLYEKSVQSPFASLAFINTEYKKLRGKKPLLLREDFSGTGWLACEWAKQSPQHKAVAVDFSQEVVEHGLTHRHAKLTPAQQKRVRYLVEDVRKARSGRFNVIVAFNFSYYLFHTRAELLDYFRKVRKALKPGGIFVIDLCGGHGIQEERTRKTKHNGFTYLWECKSFNPVTHRGAYAIHFQPKGKKIQRNAFLYDWRVWSPPELREIMADAGFKKSTPYWEGSNAKGGGDGNFTPTEWEDNCRIWRAYLIAQ